MGTDELPCMAEKQKWEVQRRWSKTSSFDFTWEHWPFSTRKVAGSLLRRNSQAGWRRVPTQDYIRTVNWNSKTQKIVKPGLPNFLDFSDPRFSALQNTLDNVFRDLCTRGVGSESKNAEVFTKEDEECLWTSDTLSVDTSKGLLRAVFFLNGNNFCLCGGIKHRQLKLSQIKRVDDPLSYVYTECASKNCPGGLVQLRVKNKVVPIHAVPEAGEHCHVYVLDRYLEKIPEAAFEKDNFYLQPVATTKEGQPWFTITPVGRNTLSTMVKTICEDGGVQGNKTNHSLRATERLRCTMLEFLRMSSRNEQAIYLSVGYVIMRVTSIEQHSKVAQILLSHENTFYHASSMARSPTNTNVPSITMSNCSNCSISIGIIPHTDQEIQGVSSSQTCVKHQQLKTAPCIVFLYFIIYSAWFKSLLLLFFKLQARKNTLLIIVLRLLHALFFCILSFILPGLNHCYCCFSSF